MDWGWKMAFSGTKRTRVPVLMGDVATRPSPRPGIWAARTLVMSTPRSIAQVVKRVWVVSSGGGGGEVGALDVRFLLAGREGIFRSLPGGLFLSIINVSSLQGYMYVFISPDFVQIGRRKMLRNLMVCAFTIIFRVITDQLFAASTAQVHSSRAWRHKKCSRS